MANHKKKVAGTEDEQWARFVNHILTRPRMKNRRVLPREYIYAIADNIHRCNATLKEITNTITSFGESIYDLAYTRALVGQKLFRDKKNKHFEDDWKNVLTTIDDVIHPNKIKSTNQKKKK